MYENLEAAIILGVSVVAMVISRRLHVVLKVTWFVSIERLTF